ncbi:bifunctional [glutamate--ammonia ligase]-adenylyl-L-tyrosine phosphorylase/[glutamate--ammonia-ligase] adenylyltransferase [Solilutibacter tolerans]|uniref:Bifunctional glutamine synthetase adenylyltransferase/adenylyl-removing enzyme n=1 Tax=Solilutibacter tolerans TaxID=1604334 RepID=A0A1N6UN40_9GAMM|nr:bifunctional [glutamate--ammonia ligase]-adenylyl-L-tyrosine phosphorylase/[glutamate--ammonia-ligase] adenylyltransferase [Lysobacter tolerans]SIQ67020.1 glutamate-ammonia-ligase adenylyltransferase [Lysobacter tolerans]
MHAAIDDRARRALDRLELPNGADDPARARLQRLAIASDFAIDTLALQPALLARLLADDGAEAASPPLLNDENRAEWPALLRRWRMGESTRLIWRDVQGLDDVESTLRGTTRLAELALAVALAALERDFAERHGVVRDAEGREQRLVVFALGKLGGGELNFSSDIDIVYGYEHDGESDGARPLAAEVYFARLGQQLAKLLDELTADGFSHRVDLRLRPYGNAGRVAWSFAALEQYFQREGRDWERYAWQKARPVAGDIAAGERFLDLIQPFVYRRYLDFGALEGLREMKALIAAEVARKDLADDIKRGPGGIREIEFLVQALQLIRAGREPALQRRGLLASLHALVEGGQIAPDTGDVLAQSYRFLRRLENRLQMLRDEQVYSLPADDESRMRLARGLGYDGWPALRAGLDAVRAQVSTEFDALLTRRQKQHKPDALQAYWKQLPEGGDASVLGDAGFEDAESLDAQLRDFLRGAAARQSSDIGRARLDRVMPALIAASANASQPDAALRRVLTLVQNILRRSSYLVLLDEQPQALTRLVDALSRSALLGERLAMYPLLLDELLDSRGADAIPDAAAMREACDAAIAQADGDIDDALRLLNETRQAISFRIALATLDATQSAADSARQLAQLADAVLASVLGIAEDELRAAHGEVPDARFAVLGYGSLGGYELGFGSDLDLVFLYDAPMDAESDGRRPIEAQRWFARLAQKIVGYLQTSTASGRLFEVDVRLRPDGSKAMLVSTLASFIDYQRERAWTWERQALVRARCAVGDAALCAEFEAARTSILLMSRDADALRADVITMRRKMRAELDRSDARLFDLKQGEGGLVDLEFLLQYLILRDAPAQPSLAHPRANDALIRALLAAGVLDEDESARLLGAHRQLLEAGLRCTLDRRPRQMQATVEITAAANAISAIARRHGLTFQAEEPKG